MKKKGFTLVELLVVIAIIAMLLAILMPALGKVRALAHRLMCGTNLGGIGKAMAVYANDYQESYPVTTGGNATTPLRWNYVNSAEFWDKDTTATPFDWTTVATATTSSSLYLLVKYSDVSTNQFVCKAGSYKKFELSTTAGNQNTPSVATIKDVTQCWDFGRAMGNTANSKGPWNYCGYAYQMPYTPTGANMIKKQMSVTSPAGVALMADASPWYKDGHFVPAVAPTTAAVGTGPYVALTAAEWGLTASGKSTERIRLANSTNHSQEGQNVLFGDSHVSFENQSNVGITQDNIYTYWANYQSNTNADLTQVQGGTTPTSLGAAVGSYNEDDSFLVN
jgi:prepilin-type N-terminal cleavage/methylation domain-containing protein